ncbi:MAG: D-aminoacylase, partial [Desulfobacula sp.]|nr:D-aminoacylase [Desulfobacula sp.]
MKPDIIIRDALIMDGTGEPAFEADIAVKSGRIEKIGNITENAVKKEIDAAGMVLTPGFIDSHSHADLTLISGSKEMEKLRMGVTTEVIGQCGFSAYPLSVKNRSLRIQSMQSLLSGGTVPWDWKNLSQFRAAAEGIGIQNNVIPMAGHGSLRIAVMGNSPAQATRSELEQMKTFLSEEMAEGALGLSVGLIYPPACYALQEEIEALCKVAAEYGGIYVTHLRGETAQRIDAAVDEAIAISKSAGIPLQISHLKVIGRSPENYGQIHRVIEKIETADREGLKIHFDCYPYTEGSTVLSALMPQWALENGSVGLLAHLQKETDRKKIRYSIENDWQSWENWVHACGWSSIKIASGESKHNKHFQGNLSTIAAGRNTDPFNALCDILLEEKANVVMVFKMMTEEDMQVALKHPLGMIGTDALPCPPGLGHPHPRGYGTFPRIIGKYAREKGLFSIEEAVRKMTALPATKYGLKGRGLIKEGMIADIVVFDSQKIIDKSTFQHPRRPPEGIVHVLVDGQQAVKNGSVTGIKAGKFLRPS